MTFKKIILIIKAIQNKNWHWTRNRITTEKSRTINSLVKYNINLGVW